MDNNIWSHLGWVLAAGLLGFAISAIFAGRLQLSRQRFLVPYLALASAFLVGYWRWSQIDVAALLAENWPWGLLAGASMGLILARTVRSQPASNRSTGTDLALDIAWVGLAYGVMDALLLNVMPVAAVFMGLSGATWTAAWPGKIAAGALALVASLLVTLLYHVGYPEFRNRSVMLVLVGNALITLAYLVSANPLGALISHPVMHVAAVLRGPETVIQLPPHYGKGRAGVGELS